MRRATTMMVAVVVLVLAALACGSPQVANTGMNPATLTQAAGLAQGTVQAILATQTQAAIDAGGGEPASETPEPADGGEPAVATTEAPLTTTEAGPPSATTPPSVTPTITATSPPPIPEAVAPAAGESGESFFLEEERIIGPYAIRLWRDANYIPGGVVTIEGNNQPRVVIQMASYVDDLTGADLTGNGEPTVVVETFSGGASCCFGLQAYDLGPTIRRVLDKVENSCGAGMQDVNGDGIYEVVTCDDPLAYEYCPGAASPRTLVYLAYDSGLQRYVPASPRYSAYYAETISYDADTAASAGPGDFGEWDDTNKCGVLPLVLDYLYSGQTANAWSALSAYYSYPDAAEFRATIEERVYGSPLYVAP